MSVSIRSVVSVSGGDVSRRPDVPRPKEINSINDLIAHKAETIPDTPLVAYPASDRSSDKLAEYTARDLDQFADVAATLLTGLGLLPKVISA